VASPQVPYQGYRYYRRRRSLFGPIVLIGIGVAFLLANMHVISGARLAWLFATWWPALLILLGLVRIVEYSIARSQGSPVPRFGGGAIFLLILFICIGLSASGARRVDWQRAFGDDVDFNGFNAAFGEKYEFTDELTQPLPPNGSIRVDNNRGAVTIHASQDSGNSVKLVVRRHIAADSQNEANDIHSRQAATMTPDGSVLHIDSGQHEASGHVGFYVGPRSVSDMEIWAPAKAAVDISTAHGDVNVADRQADVTVSTTHGDVQLSQIKGNISLTAHSGDLQISDITGNVKIDGKADDVTLSDITGGVSLDGEFYGDTKLSHVGSTVQFRSSRTDLQLAKLSGDLDMDSGDLRANSIVGPLRVTTKAKDIHLEDVSGAINIDDSHGEVEVHPQSPFGDLTVNNHQGAIHVVLPEDAGYTVDARSTRGELETDFPLNISEQGPDRTTTGTLGKGGSKLQLTTDHGTIEIRKG